MFRNSHVLPNKFGNRDVITEREGYQSTAF